MKKNLILKTLFLSLCIHIILTSCRENSDTIPSFFDDNNVTDSISTFAEFFKDFWIAMNCNYPIWDYEAEHGINWDNVFNEYYPKFQMLDNIADGTNDREIRGKTVQMLDEILSPLHDGHFTVEIKYLDSTGVAHDWYDYQPQKKRVSERNDYASIKQTNINYYYSGTAGSNQVIHFEKYSKEYEYAEFEDGILYLKIERFYASIYETFLEQDDKLRLMWYSWFNRVQELHKQKKLKGIIIDLRNNSGGNDKNYQYVIGALQAPDVNNEVRVGYTRRKVGVGRNDFSPLTPMLYPVYNDEHAIIKDEHIVVLSNCWTSSCAEICCEGAKKMSNARIIGTQTWGCLSPFVDKYEKTYAGEVSRETNTRFPIKLRIPSAAYFTENKKIIEGIGIIPDIPVELDVDEYERTGGRDTQLERALDYIRTGK